MMANGIVGKVLDKVSKSEAFDGNNPSKFIMGCVSNSLLKFEKLAAKRKAEGGGTEDIPQTSGAASSSAFDHRPHKGGKWR